MKPNPYLHAVFAELYIITVVLVLFYVPKMLDIPDSLIIPITILSLLVLSVTVMSYLFFYVPLRHFLEGRKEEGLSFFLRTVATFSVLALCALGVLYLSVYIL